MAHPTAPPSLSANDRRRRRIERQLRALRVMRGHLTTKEIAWAVLTIPGIALLCLVVGAKLHWMSNSAPLALAGALVAGVVVFPSFWGGDDPVSKSKREKMDRRQKLERAIARREALLRSLDNAAPR